MTQIFSYLNIRRHDFRLGLLENSNPYEFRSVKIITHKLVKKIYEKDLEIGKKNWIIKKAKKISVKTFYFQ